MQYGESYRCIRSHVYPQKLICSAAQMKEPVRVEVGRKGWIVLKCNIDNLGVEVHKLGLNEDFNFSREVLHDVLTDKDGIIVMIEPYNDFKNDSQKRELMKRNHLISSFS